MFGISRSHLLWLTIGTLLALFSLVSIILFTDPETSGLPVHILLYTALFLFTIGCCTTFGIFFRQRFLSGIYYKNFITSFRQAILLGILITGLLLLQINNLLLWWIVLIFVLLLTTIEAFFNLE